jgi:hypothetical protein
MKHNQVIMITLIIESKLKQSKLDRLYYYTIPTLLDYYYCYYDNDFQLLFSKTFMKA